MQSAYIRYYAQQEGGRYSRNDNEFGNLLRLPKVYQRGRGLGGVFGSFWKYLYPLLEKGANFLKDELIETGADVLRNINTQKPINDILRDRSVQVVDKLRNNAVDKINSMVGSGIKRRQGEKIKRKKCKTKTATRNTINRKIKSQKSQLQTLAIRVKRSTKTKPKTKQNRILDIFT